jgi:SNF2 family DNA or RNA helicase
MDESHYLRNCPAGRTKVLLGKDNGLVHNTERAWFLSGTPAVNHYAELWPLLRVCGIYPNSYESFVREFCEGHWGPYGFRITGSKNSARLRELLAGFMLRRKFTEVAPELPPIEVADYTVELPRVAASLDSPVLRAALDAPDPMAALEAAAPAVATLRRYLGLAKVPAVADLARTTLDGNDEKIVLFTYHREVLNALALALAEFHPAVIAGGMPPGRRERSLRSFRENPKCRVFIGQIVAAGTAIDLSAASQALMVESSWVPGENAQALMRLQNLNQTARVSARFIGMTDSLDAQIQRVVRRKTRDLDKLFG